MSKQTYRGSCHCGAVKFEAELDLSEGSGRCNCSVCTKRRSWGITLKPEAFRLLSGADELSTYEFATRSAHHHFCRRCGVHLYGSGYVEEIGGAYCSVQVSCLDDVPPETFAEIPIRYLDGRQDNWFAEPAFTQYL